MDLVKALLTIVVIDFIFFVLPNALIILWRNEDE